MDIDANKVIQCSLNASISSCSLFYGKVRVYLYLVKVVKEISCLSLNETFKYLNDDIDFRHGLTGFVIALQHLKNNTLTKLGKS